MTCVGLSWPLELSQAGRPPIASLHPLLLMASAEQYPLLSLSACRASVGDKISRAAWRSKPSWYLVAAKDETIPPAVERDSAAHMKGETLVLQSGHVPMLSQPEAVADFVASAAAAIDA